MIAAKVGGTGENFFAAAAVMISLSQFFLLSFSTISSFVEVS